MTQFFQGINDKRKKERSGNRYRLKETEETYQPNAVCVDLVEIFT